MSDPWAQESVPRGFRLGTIVGGRRAYEDLRPETGAVSDPQKKYGEPGSGAVD